MVVNIVKIRGILIKVDLKCKHPVKVSDCCDLYKKRRPKRNSKSHSTFIEILVLGFGSSSAYEASKGVTFRRIQLKGKDVSIVLDILQNTAKAAVTQRRKYGTTLKCLRSRQVFLN